MQRPRLNTLDRPAMPAEFVPADYFRRLGRHELLRDGRPLEVDLGCGDGSFLLDLAGAHPERDFLGVERLLGRAAKVCRRITRAGLDNARVLRLESRYTIEWLMPESSVSRLHLMCPDPWPKLRHHRRRLVQDGFLDALARVLADEGEFLFMTDDRKYFDWSLEKTEAHSAFVRIDWEEESFFHPKTDFQRQWEAEGRVMWRARWRKVATESAPEHDSGS